MGNEQGRILTLEEIRSRDNLNVIDGELKRKLNNKSIKYNLKLVIKGDRNTGKSSLFQRLQGFSFTSEYNPTPEIQISHINWNYKNTDDIVDVEVWDVVDVAKKTNKTDLIITNNKGNNTTNTSNTNNNDTEENLDSFYNDFDPKKLDLKSNNRSGSFKFQNLDAQTLNVYKNANAVIFMVDPSKKWTFTYVEQELKKIPKDIFILLITNFRDKNPIGTNGGTCQNQSTILTQSDIDLFCEQRDNIYHIEASMLNAYGLKSIVNFFNIPFLHTQRVSLEKQLERNAIEIQCATEEVNIVIKDQNYDGFIKSLELRKSQQQQLQQQQTNQTSPELQPKSNVQNQNSNQPITSINLGNSNNKISPTISSNSNNTVAQPIQQNSNNNNNSSGGFFSRFTKSIGINIGNNNNQPSQPIQPALQTNANQVTEKLTNVEDFNSSLVVGDDDDFYNERPKSKVEILKNLVKPSNNITNTNTNNNTKFGDDSDSDDDFNPLVAKNQDEDDDDEIFKKPIKPLGKSSKPVSNIQQKTTEAPKKPTVTTSPPKSIFQPNDNKTSVNKVPSSSSPSPSPIKSSPLKSSNDIIKKPPIVISSSPKTTPTKVDVVQSPISKEKEKEKNLKNKYQGFGNESDEEDNPFVTKDQDSDEDDFRYQKSTPKITSKPIQQPTKIENNIDSDDSDEFVPPPTGDNLDNWLDD